MLSKNPALCAGSCLPDDSRRVKMVFFYSVVRFLALMADANSLLLENDLLRARVLQLEAEVAFLRTHPVFVQGLKGETLVASLTGGELTAFAAKHDVVVRGKVTIEVKFSKLNIPVLGRDTRHWNWSKPLGWKDKGKTYDYLLLVGEKDHRFPHHYLDDSPYIFFLLPKSIVPTVCSIGRSIGAMVQITTNLVHAKSPTSRVLRSHMVSQTEVKTLLSNTHRSKPSLERTSQSGVA